MEQKERLLEVENLSIVFPSKIGKQRVEKKALDGLSLSLLQGKTLALVGESGCGKSIFCKSIMDLLPTTAHRVSGSIRYKGSDLMLANEKQIGRIRGKEISMIAQDPVSCFHPMIPVGKQIIEGARRHLSLSKKEAKAYGLSLLEQVGIEKERFDSYPDEFSGGMLQRCAIATAISCNPQLLIADEPTTALDVVTQLQILELLKNLQKQRGMTLLFITHDLAVARKMADQIGVMSRGRLVEFGDVEEIFEQPKEEETKELIKAVPTSWGWRG